MATIIKPSQLVNEITYLREFEYKNDPGAGYSFYCNETGDVDVHSLNPMARQNWDLCNSAPHLIDLGVKEYRRNYWSPAELRCDCGATFELYDAFLSTCPNCGSDYNGSGQRLAPRHFWGEETGESLGDILAGGW